MFLRERGFEHVVTLGHSGGGTLYAFYHQQAGLAPADRIATTPAGRPVALAEADMPRPDGAVFMAPHPGQGTILARLIDPSVTDERDPLSVDPALDPYDPANGFAPPGQSSSYPPEFVDRYRAAQRDRIARIDARGPGGVGRGVGRPPAVQGLGRSARPARRPGAAAAHGLPDRRRPAVGRPEHGRQRAALRFASSDAVPT